MRVFVARLHYDTDEQELRAFFGDRRVTEIKIVRDPSGTSRGFAFCDFATAADAENAIAELDGRELRNRRVVLEAARKTRMPMGSPARERSRGGD